MVIAGFGQEVEEAKLRRLCDCTFEGTSAFNALNAARQLGFANSSKHNLAIEELEAIIADGWFPIVFVDLTPATMRRTLLSSSPSTSFLFKYSIPRAVKD